MKHDILGAAVDEENNVYLVVRYHNKNGYDETETDHVVLYVFDEHCNHVKHKSELNFRPKLKSWHLPLEVNKNKDIVMKVGDNVYVCDFTGQLKFIPKCSPSSIVFQRTMKSSSDHGEATLWKFTQKKEI